MFRKFLSDVRGNYAILTGIAIVPILGAVAVGVDYTEMSRQRQDTLNALDASCIATARRVLEGASDTDARTYARKFLDANLGAAKPANVDLGVELPTNAVGGGRVQLSATLKYTPHFLPPFRSLINDGPVDAEVLTFTASSTCQLKNTVEVALVLDNSGSMDEKGKGSGKKRIDLLKSAASQLVDQLAATAQIMKQVEKPVQFSVVPFAASVNIGPANATESWMDTTGISPIHHENFDWSTMPSNMQIKQLTAGGPYYKKGNGWGSAENQIVTRFTLFDDLKRQACDRWGNNCTLQTYASWGGCVESRPYPYNTNDTAPDLANPSTLYVPMFAPDEADSSSAENSWWTDVSSSGAMTRQRYAYKYYGTNPKISAAGTGEGPNDSCTTTPITPLTDVTTNAGLTTIKDAINAMQPNGATNVPEGLAWGWRTLSSQAPFTGGRSETERGNDKVVIVLTDGANTYYTPSSLGYSDAAGNQSTYSAYGYARLNDGSTPGRIFSGTSSSVSKSDYSNSNYSAAMNEQFLATCKNANGGESGGGAGLIIMTVALDLDATKSDDQKQLSMLQTCASRSRYARDPSDLTKGKKLFWNATGSNLSQVFREIADELSNLRIVG